MEVVGGLTAGLASLLHAHLETRILGIRVVGLVRSQNWCLFRFKDAKEGCSGESRYLKAIAKSPRLPMMVYFL